MGSRSRRILAITLLVLAGLLVPVAVVATWTARTVTDTESFVSRVGPVASQPEVQALVSTQLADQVTGAVIDDRVAPRVGEAIDELAAPELVKGLLRDVAASLGGAVEARVQNVADKIVTSPEFQSAFDTALDEAHAELVATLEGDEPQGTVITEGTTVSISLATIAGAVRAELVNSDAERYGGSGGGRATTTCSRSWCGSGRCSSSCCSPPERGCCATPPCQPCGLPGPASWPWSPSRSVCAQPWAQRPPTSQTRWRPMRPGSSWPP